MRVGFMQIAPVLGNLEATIRKIESLLRTEDTADILVLPELCNSGYNFESQRQAWDTSETIEDSRFVRFLEHTCKTLQFHTIAGLNERDGDRLYNTSVLVGPKGLIGRYRKLHLFLNEKDYFTPGDIGLPVFNMGWWKLGMLICLDWLFPEAWRVLALKGVDLICHPSCLISPTRATRAALVHAQCNGVFVVTANRVGAERDFVFKGNSAIASPKGETLMEASEDDEEIGIVTIDPLLSRDKMITSRNHVLEDRRPREYGLVTRDKGA